MVKETEFSPEENGREWRTQNPSEPPAAGMKSPGARTRRSVESLGERGGHV